MKVALATCTNLPEPDRDEELVLEALRARGLAARMLAWDDPAHSPMPGELVVLRSTWNYYRDLPGFLAWIDRTAGVTRLLNPAGIVRTNAKKTYLRELEARGVAIVPTELVMRGERLSIADLTRSRHWPTIVVKPVVSAGSFQTRRFEGHEVEEAQAFLDALAAERDVMIQRWIPSVETYGERSLVWIDGALSHAIRKSPRFAGGAESVSVGTEPIDSRERAFAERVLEPIAKDLLYARVDVVWDDDVLHLMELELIEPSLFLEQHPPGLARLADAIARHAGVGST